MQRIRVWDLPTRIFHWALVACVIGSFVSVKIGGNAMVWHGRFGLTVVGLLAFRLVWGFIGSTYARFAQFVRGPRAIKDYLQGRWQGEGHNPLGALSVLAAVLAVLGYSVNESVVVFDRVRETFKKKRGMTTPEVLDHAITSTISRTIITHGSTQMMVTSMLIFGGPALHYFALALTIGICFGIYSSVLVASPLVMWLGVSRAQFVQAKVEKQEAVV